MKHFLTGLALILLIVACKDEKQTVITQETPMPETVEIPVDTVAEVKEQAPIKSIATIKQELKAQGYQTFDYVDKKTGDTILMQQYFMAFLKSGPIRNQNEEETAKLQEAHLAHLARMYEEGFADISGPFGDNGDIRGITIYNVPTQKMADSLAHLDPMVQARRLEVEVRPWWAAKGFPLR